MSLGLSPSDLKGTAGACTFDYRNNHLGGCVDPEKQYTTSPNTF